MTKLLPLFLCCILISMQGMSQSMVKFENNNRAHYCTGFVFHRDMSGLTVSNTTSAQCDRISMELQVHDFSGVGTYSLALHSGNYGFYNATDSVPGMQTPTLTGDPGGGTVIITRYDSLFGILEGYFSMVVSRHMYDSTDFTTQSITNGYFSFGTCYAVFHIAPTAMPHQWSLFYRTEGAQPVNVTFYWGD